MCKLLQQVPFVVECKSSYPFWEVIAAFNVDSVAKYYAEECKKVNPNFQYRVKMVID